jgi:gluconolactonase
MKKIIPLLIAISMFGCNNEEQPKTIGTIEKMDPAFEAIVSSNAKVEIIAEGFEWSEGPLWVEKHQMLLFSDVPTNTIYKWTEAKGKEIYLKPSGYTGTVGRGGEMGSNGLILDSAGNLVLCQHGDRRMARMDAPLDKPAPQFITLADKYNNKRLSSPNDAVYVSSGELFFTDPPYGLLSKSDTDSAKELSWNGVYKLKTNGEVILLSDTLTRPNGIAFFPGEHRLIVANSDPALPNWYVYDINGDSLRSAGIFHSAAGSDKKWKGLPDGLKIDKNGNVFASGPGGVWFFNPEGKLLGMLRLDQACSNIALSGDEKTLYITNDMQVLRFKMRD